MFWGSHRVSVDAKGRIAIPAVYRKDLGDMCFATASRDRCLAIYTLERRDEIRTRMADPDTADDAEARMTARRFFGLGQEFQFDAQGRVTLSEDQRRYAGITPGGKVVVSGQGKHVEIWSEERWDASLHGADASV